MRSGGRTSGVAEGGFAQSAEAVEEPGPQFFFRGIDVDGKVDIVGYEERGLCSALEDVEALQNDDVRPVHELAVVRQNVVVLVGVEGHVQRGKARFEVGHEPQEPGPVIAFRKAFAVHDAA